MLIMISSQGSSDLTALYAAVNPPEL
jgi:hypothetical protein